MLTALHLLYTTIWARLFSRMRLPSQFCTLTGYDILIKTKFERELQIRKRGLVRHNNNYHKTFSIDELNVDKLINF